MKHLNTKFIKQIIDLEFPFVKTFTKQENLNSPVKHVQFGKNQYHILDIFKLNSSLKQFIRILYHLRYKKNDISKLYIYIWCSNKFILSLIEIFIKEYKIRQYIILCDLFPTIDFVEAADKRKLLLVLGNPWTKKSEEMLHSRVLNNRIFLVNSLNFLNEKKQHGFYKIQNDLADYKKLIVLLTIIDRVININIPNPNIKEMR